LETTVQDILETEDTDPPEKIKPCDLKKLIEKLKLKKACGIDGIPNECLRHLPRRPLVHLTHLFNHCLRLSYFPNSWKEAKIITLPKAGKDTKFPQNLRPISLLTTTGKLFEKVIQKIIQKHIDANNLLNANQFGFRASHSTTFQCVRLTDHITLNFNNNMSTAVVFMDIEKAFDTTWHTGLLYKLAKLKFPVYLIKLMNSYLINRKFRVSMEGEMSTPRIMQAGVPQGSVLAPILYNLYINDIPRTPGVHLALFADDTCIYATDRNERYVKRKLQRGLSAIEKWCEHWNIKINEDKTRAVYFSKRIRRNEMCITLKGQNIEFVNNVKYLGVILDLKNDMENPY
jgi:retron-type reverse transcriptase